LLEQLHLLRVFGPPRAFLTSKMTFQLFPSLPVNIKTGEIIIFEQWRAVIIVCSVYNICTQALQRVPYAHHCVFFISNFFVFSFFQQKILRNLLGENLFFCTNSRNFAKVFEKAIAIFLLSSNWKKSWCTYIGLKPIYYSKPT
jgi:hypothetical protein